MFKRTFWFTTGATAGFGSAMWLRRRVVRTVQRYTPEHVQADLTDSVRRWGDDVRAAIADGRAAMASREAALRAELEGGPAAAAAAALPTAPGDRRAVIDVGVAGDDATPPARGTLRRAGANASGMSHLG